MATTPQYAVLTQEQRNSIASRWKNNPMTIDGEWQQATTDGLVYTTSAIMDLLRLYFSQNATSYIYEKVPFNSVSISNSWADKIESVPNVIVQVGSYSHLVPEINLAGRTDADLHRYIPERYSIELAIVCESTNILGCDMLTSRVGSAFIEMLIPTMSDLTMPINSMRNLRVSAPAEKRRSSSFVTIYRTMSVSVWLDFVPMRALNHAQILQGVDTQETP